MKIRNTQSYGALLRGLWEENPVFRQVLGICSTLAVTNYLLNTAIMCAGLVFTLCASCVTVSLLRNYTPVRVRMMVQTLIIASYVVIVDIVIKAKLPEISEQLGPYVGLIITNCIVMGRCESFARSNRPLLSFWDALGNSLGYSGVLMVIAFFRELLGFRSLFGYPVLGDWFLPWTVMVMAPGAFFMLGILVWLARYHSEPQIKEGGN
ncbi:MAG: NADH:ubiquinone reductase (Na(+)-transporting) subunit D [Planctomycetes bacterium]|nr:NADH:ubiquinone reductase (Na(+)-transporting) subunit D [Planctomycetota bacterium]